MSSTEQLAQLEAADLIRRTADAPEAAYLFRHALIHDAAYNTLVRSDRRALHRQIGGALEELFPDRRDELAARLAQHYIAGEDWARAAHFAQRAGERALSVHAQREAGDYFQHALDALARLPSATAQQQYDAWLGWAQAWFKYKPFPVVLEGFARAEQIARELDDPHRLLMALNWIARVHIASGHGTRGFPVAVEAYALAQALGDERLTIVPGYVSAHVRMGVDPRATIAQLDDVLRLARKYHDVEMEGYAFGIKGMVHARLGEFAQSQDAIGHALEIVSAIDAPLVESDVNLFAGWSYLDSGDSRRALEYGQRGIDLALAADNMDCVCFGFACVGFGNLQAGNLPQALSAFQETVRRAAESGAEPVEGIGRAGLALARFFGGHAGDSAEITQALAQARAGGDPYMAAQLSQALGEIMLQSGQRATAEQYLSEALDYYRANEMQPHASRVLDVLARLHASKGDEPV